MIAWILGLATKLGPVLAAGKAALQLLGFFKPKREDGMQNALEEKAKADARNAQLEEEIENTLRKRRLKEDREKEDTNFEQGGKW